MSNLHPKRKVNDPNCSCVDGQYQCWHCRKPILDAIIARQTPEQAEYDRLALAGWRSEDDDWHDGECCSCHINAPCRYCENHCAECSEHVDDCQCFDEATE